MKIEHVALYVRDLEKAKNFFVQYLGAKANDGYFNQKTGFRSYFLTFDSGTRLEIMTRERNCRDRAKYYRADGLKIKNQSFGA